MRCRWRDFLIRRSNRTWPRSSRPAAGGRVRAGGRSARSQGACQTRRGPGRHPGTLTDDELLDPRTANYLAAVVEAGGKMGLAWVELSTGRFSLTGLLRHELVDELARLSPAEILISELSLDAPWARALRGQSGMALTVRPSWDFQAEQARTTLFDQFRTKTLAGFGVDDRGVEVQAAGALLAYLRETQKTSLGHITRLIPYRRADTLALDEMTRRSLELVRTLREGKREGSLLSVIDCSATPMGARLLSEWLTSPLTSTELIAERLEAVEELFNQSALRGDLRSLLGQSYDLERLAGRIGTGRATPRDLVALAKTLAILPKLKARLTARVSKRLNQLEGGLELCPEIRAEIEAALWDDPPLAVKEGGLIRDGYHRGPRRTACQCQGGQVVDRQVSGRAGQANRRHQPQSRIQQGLRLLHRDHPRPGTGPRREHP